LERQTHLDQLADKLPEERVSRIVLPILLGETNEKPNLDDQEYCIDLGLIKKTKEGVQIANAIYKEIIPRTLTSISQDEYFNGMDVDWINKDGSLNVYNLLTQFKDFWNENNGIIKSDLPGYSEALHHLIIQAFLQRIINGGGTINREYGLGRKRTDIMVKWKYPPLTEGGQRGEFKYQKIVLEIKTINKKQKYETLIEKALTQTAQYAHTCGEKEAQLLIFDKDYSQNWQPDTPNETITHDGITITIWKFTKD
jgi:hypothetical protein